MQGSKLPAAITANAVVALCICCDAPLKRSKLRPHVAVPYFITCPVPCLANQQIVMVYFVPTYGERTLPHVKKIKSVKIYYLAYFANYMQLAKAFIKAELKLSAKRDLHQRKFCLDTSFCCHWHRMCGNISFHTLCHHYRGFYMNFPHLNLLKLSQFYNVFAWKRAVFRLLSHMGVHVVLPKPRQNLDRKSTSAFPIGPCDQTSEFNKIQRREHRVFSINYPRFYSV